MVTLLPVVLARDQLTTPFGGSMLVEQADTKDKIRATAKAMARAMAKAMAKAEAIAKASGARGMRTRIGTTMAAGGHRGSHRQQRISLRGLSSPRSR